MYHAVEITKDNIQKIEKWIPTSPLREMFRLDVAYIDIDKRNFLVMHILSDGRVEETRIVRSDVIEMLKDDIVIVTLN